MRLNQLPINILDIRRKEERYKIYVLVFTMNPNDIIENLISNTFEIHCHLDRQRNKKSMNSDFQKSIDTTSIENYTWIRNLNMISKSINDLNYCEIDVCKPNPYEVTSNSTTNEYDLRDLDFYTYGSINFGFNIGGK